MVTIMTSRLKCIKVRTPHHVELMRCIYNENLEMLSTHEQLTTCTYEQQQAWWNIAKEYSDAYLYEPIDKPGKFVAFLLLRHRDGFCTPTVAIQREEQGNHYGHEIIHDYIVKSNGPIAGFQLQRNSAICHINKKVGWQIVGESGVGDSRLDLLFHPGINPKNMCSKVVFINILKYLGLKPDAFEYDKLNKPINIVE